ncbi:DUF2341 domain-containing protein [Pyrodictium abyssi]|uniref:DUF2341 domain-containing protein n=1 Tax=Pyrodictium abyssi TaxID=54256 RepID=A0ABM8IXP5_9CREN|nr:hypothetical protein PABY_04580 [Pyrodictium abyssi]
MPRGFRSVGSLAGMVFLAVMIFMAIGFAFVVLSAFDEYSSVILAIMGERASMLGVTSSITGWWMIGGSDLLIHLETSYPKSLTLTGMAVLWDDGTVTIMDQGNATLYNVVMVVGKPDGTTYTVSRLPVVLGPGYQVNITLAGYASGREPVSISASLSASPAVAVVPIRRYVPTYTVPVNVTVTPTPSYNYTPALVQLLPMVFSGYTTAVRVYQATLGPEEAFSPAGYSVVYGVRVSGDLSSLSARDGNTLNIQSQSYVVCEAYSGWRYYREVEIVNNNPYSYQDIQVKITLSRDNFDFTKANPDGSDVRVLAEDCTPLPYWIEKWDPDRGKAVIWVRIPSIEANGRVKIMLVYGNPSATSHDPQYYGLDKVMERLPAEDGPGYTIYYQEWVMPVSGLIGGGTAMGWHADDGAWRYTLPFSFPFYSKTLTQVYVCSNGFISEKRITDFSDSLYELRSRLMIAPFWEDLMTWRPYDIYIRTDYRDEYGRAVVIRWYTDFYYRYGVANFELVLYENGLIRFNYGRIDGRSYDRPTVGLSLGDRKHYTVSTYNDKTADNLSNAASVMFWPRKKPQTEFTATVGQEKLFSVYRAGVEISYPLEGMASITGLEVYANDPGTPYSYEVLIIAGGVPVYTVSGEDQSGPLSISLSGLRIPVDGPVTVRVVVTRFSGFQLQLDQVRLTVNRITMTGSRIAIASSNTSTLLLYDPATGASAQIDLATGGFPATGVTLLAMDSMVRGVSTWLWVVRGDLAVPYDLFNETWVADHAITLATAVAEGGFVASNGTHLYVYPGGGASRVYVYSIETGVVMNTIQLPVAPGTYTSTAQAGMALYIHTGEAGRLLALNLVTGEVTELGTTPSIYPVGMAYDPDRGRLWVVLRGGGVEYYDLSAGRWEAYSVAMPYYPLNPGDRLVYIDNRLYHVRNDGTSSLLELQLG